jgi:hypothetical protein
MHERAPCGWRVSESVELDVHLGKGIFGSRFSTVRALESAAECNAELASHDSETFGSEDLGRTIVMRRFLIRARAIVVELTASVERPQGERICYGAA